MSEIKVLFGAPTGCTSPKNVRPGISPCTLCICSYNNWLKNRAHTGCTSPKIVHPAVKMCAPGTGCTLNFGHCCNCIHIHIHIHIYISPISLQTSWPRTVSSYRNTTRCWLTPCAATRCSPNWSRPGCSPTRRRTVRHILSNTVCKTKGIPCTRCAHFECRVHVFWNLCTWRVHVFTKLEIGLYSEKHMYKWPSKIILGYLQAAGG